MFYTKFNSGFNFSSFIIYLFINKKVEYNIYKIYINMYLDIFRFHLYVVQRGTF